MSKRSVVVEAMALKMEGGCERLWIHTSTQRVNSEIVWNVWPFCQSYFVGVGAAAKWEFEQEHFKKDWDKNVIIAHSGL